MVESEPEIEISPWSGDHTKWLVDLEIDHTTADGSPVKVLEFRHENDDEVMKGWARHVRNHYCRDCDLDLMKSPGQSRQDYLTNIKFPSTTSNLGPSIRAGDFGEILVADYLQWLLKCWVPRMRWGAKSVRDESPKGSDVLGFRFVQEGRVSRGDSLFVYEVKTKFSRRTTTTLLQDALKDSAKDDARIAESLNYVKQRLLEKHETNSAKLIARFQTPVDIPYSSIYGAAAVASEEFFLDEEINKAETATHPHKDQLAILVIRGRQMMPLIHELYRRAADEA